MLKDILEVGKQVFALSREIGTNKSDHKEMRDRQGQSGLRQSGQGTRHLVQAPDPADIGHRNGQGDNPFRFSQRRGHAIPLSLGRFRNQFSHGITNHCVRTVVGQAADRGGFPHRQIGEIAAIAAQAPQQSGDLRARGLRQDVRCGGER